MIFEGRGGEQNVNVIMKHIATPSWLASSNTVLVAGRKPDGIGMFPEDYLSFVYISSLKIHIYEISYIYISTPCKYMQARRGIPYTLSITHWHSTAHSP